MLKDIIKNILVDKNCELIYNEEYFKNFNYFLLLKIFSTNLKLIPFCTYFNKLLYKTPLSKYDIHSLFIRIFPKMNLSEISFFSLKNNFENDIIYIQKYFDCGENDARFYNLLYEKSWRDNIKTYISNFERR